MVDEVFNVAPGAVILPGDITVTGVRSSGPGGQNVNKVASTAVLKYFPATASGLSEEIREKILSRLKARLTNEGSLVLRSSRFRKWNLNRREAVRKLAMILAGALVQKKDRVPTQPTRASRKRRVEGKRRRSQTKQGRRSGNWDPE